MFVCESFGNEYFVFEYFGYEVLYGILTEIARCYRYLGVFLLSGALPNT